MKTLRMIFAIAMIVSAFSIAFIDFRTPGAGWKVPVLGVLYGTANIIIFACKD
jgi:hypothetical protein